MLFRVAFERRNEMKKMTAILLSFAMCGGVFSTAAVSAGEAPSGGAPTGFTLEPSLYAHAVAGAKDGEAWQAWQSIHDEDFNEEHPEEKYFFLPTSAAEDSVEVYNAFSQSVTLNGVAIPAGESRVVGYSTESAYSVLADGDTYTLRYMKSHAEAAIYINNSDADGSGNDLLTYLNANKENKSKATGAVVSPDGVIDNTPIKKIKGRGNTSWAKPKKGYNITYNKEVSVGGMAKNKKYSILPNYQDDSLSRNRFLYDLSDAVGMPYASDSRYVDFYVNGFYLGSYQMAEKVEAGSLVTDVTGKEYLNKDGTVKEDFPFIAEVDAGADESDYYVTCSGSTKITIKAPELEEDDPGYEEVKAYVAEKYNELIKQCRTATRRSNVSIADLIDLDSAAKLYLINELGKNWDSGVSSTFFTYKQDENGKYKFYASPVWDYDNSLGNAVGIKRDLQNMGVSDYEEYTGWWCRFKGKSSNENMSYNIINNLSRNKEVLATAANVWFEEFLPAINHFSGKTRNSAVADELYSAEQYYSLLKDSAEMNYTGGWLLRTGNWVAERKPMKTASFDFYTGEYALSAETKSYEMTFDSHYSYAVDWMVSRAAWMSNEMYADYKGSKVPYDVDRDGVFGINDATEVQRFLAEFSTPTKLQVEIADVDQNNRMSISDVTAMQRIIANIA